MLRVLTTFALVGGLLPRTEGIVASPDSPCSADCGNVLSSTAEDDIQCNQGSYGTNNAAQLFQGCIDCELQSGFTSQDSSDAASALYNLRYATSYCLFGLPKNDHVIDTPCVTSKACGPFKEAIQFGNLTSKFQDYDFCAVWPVTDKLDFTGCRECLQAGGQEYLANFVTVLQAGCQQQPVPGVTISIEGDVFSTDRVNITAPTPSATVNPDWFDHGPLNLGAKVGIGAGGFVALLVLAGCCIVWNGKRRRRAYLRRLETKMSRKAWPASPQVGGHGGEMFETPMSQRPLRGWDDSPMSAQTDSAFPRYFSPYSSQYNSPVSAQDPPAMQWPEAARGRKDNIGVALSPDGTRSGKQEFTETYEMHEVESAGSSSSKARSQVSQDAPVLNHPGYGRHGSSQPRTYDAQEASHRQGQRQGEAF